jgi:hypothetical protein
MRQPLGELVVVEGVAAGEKIVVEGKQNLRPGTPVKEAASGGGSGSGGKGASAAPAPASGASR